MESEFLFGYIGIMGIPIGWFMCFGKSNRDYLPSSCSKVISVLYFLLHIDLLVCFLDFERNFDQICRLFKKQICKPSQ